VGKRFEIRTRFSRNPMEPDWPDLWALAARRFTLGPSSLHGSDHWQRVERNALDLAPHTPGVDVLIVRLFAVLHDSNRHNESWDPEHGARAADWARELNESAKLFRLDDARLDLLCDAMARHDKGQVSDDPTIGTCWDADRLDLPRVGIRPATRFMSTLEGKRRAGTPSRGR
jgi:uncharacterized protein